MCIRDRYKELIAEYNTLNEASQKEQLIDLQQFIHSNPETFSSILFLNNYATTIDMAELESMYESCLLYTSDAADERSSVDLGGRRIIKKKKKKNKKYSATRHHLSTHTVLTACGTTRLHQAERAATNA